MCVMWVLGEERGKKGVEESDRVKGEGRLVKG